jgi:hypothetical protein
VSLQKTYRIANFFGEREELGGGGDVGRQAEVRAFEMDETEQVGGERGRVWKCRSVFVRKLQRRVWCTHVGFGKCHPYSTIRWLAEKAALQSGGGERYNGAIMKVAFEGVGGTRSELPDALMPGHDFKGH